MGKEKIPEPKNRNLKIPQFSGKVAKYSRTSALDHWFTIWNTNYILHVPSIHTTAAGKSSSISNNTKYWVHQCISTHHNCIHYIVWVVFERFNGLGSGHVGLGHNQLNILGFNADLVNLKITMDIINLAPLLSSFLTVLIVLVENIPRFYTE